MTFGSNNMLYTMTLNQSYNSDKEGLFSVAKMRPFLRKDLWWQISISHVYGTSGQLIGKYKREEKKAPNRGPDLYHYIFAEFIFCTFILKKTYSLENVVDYFFSVKL